MIPVMCSEIFKLQEEISSLKKSLEDLTKRYERAIKSLGGTDELLMKSDLMHENDIRDIAERLAILESFVHPNLAKDMSAIHKIVGDAAGDEVLIRPLFSKPGEKDEK
jgi:hypothetical protein